VGGSRPVKINIRIIATSNRDLAEEVKKGTFREDLLFRLNVVNLRIPALRERPADIEALADHFAHKYSEMNSIPFRPLSEGARAILRAHRWQGNVRELENTLHRAVLLSSGSDIGPDAISLPDGSRPHDQGSSQSAQPGDASPDGMAGGAASGVPLVGRTVADVERDLIIDTLKHCLGNRTHAANILGISIRTLRNKLNQYQSEGLPVPAPGEGARASLS
jgi:DNA-binding NtrC family response regulator